MQFARHIPLRRSDRKSQMETFREAVASLQAGNSLIAFPEGTRSKVRPLHLTLALALALTLALALALNLALALPCPGPRPRPCPHSHFHLHPLLPLPLPLPFPLSLPPPPSPFALTQPTRKPNRVRSRKPPDPIYLPAHTRTHPYQPTQRTRPRHFQDGRVINFKKGPFTMASKADAARPRSAVLAGPPPSLGPGLS